MLKRATRKAKKIKPKKVEIVKPAFKPVVTAPVIEDAAPAVAVLTEKKEALLKAIAGISAAGRFRLPKLRAELAEVKRKLNK